MGFCNTPKNTYLNSSAKISTVVVSKDCFSLELGYDFHEHCYRSLSMELELDTEKLADYGRNGL